MTACSLRTLCRALRQASRNIYGRTDRSIYEVLLLNYFLLLIVIIITNVLITVTLSHKCCRAFYTVSIEKSELSHTHTHTHPFNGPLSGTTQVSRYQKGKTNLDFTEARDSEWQWHQLGFMQVCTSLQADNHASTPPLSFLQAGCPSCHPTNNV